MWKTFRAALVALLLGWATLVSAAVDVNKASQAELESIKGIGPAMSGRILDERKKSTFKDWDDLLLRVEGMGPGNARKMSEAGLTVNGGAFTASAAVKPAKAAKAAADEGSKK